jgi:hypothetical protein
MNMLLSISRVVVPLVLIALTGCSSLPVPQREIALAAGPVASAPSAANTGRVVLLNEMPHMFKFRALGEPTLNVAAVNRDMWLIGGMGNLNIWLNGKSVGQLELGTFLALDLPLGEHELTLLHNAPFDVKSTHRIVVYKDWSMFLVFPKDFSNGVEPVAIPRPDYLKPFTQMK